MTHVPATMILDMPTVAFRRFSRREHAEAFAAGIVRVSTVAKCRAHENAVLRDERELITSHHEKLLVGGSHNPKFVRRAARLRATIRRTERVVFHECRSTSTGPDAFLLCMTHDGSDTSVHLGPHVVRIDNPATVIEALSRVMRSKHALAQILIGSVAYPESRDTEGDEELALPTALVKPKVPFKRESEFRALWLHRRRDFKLYPFKLRVPGMAQHCTLLDEASIGDHGSDESAH